MIFTKIYRNIKELYTIFRVKDWWYHIIPPILGFCFVGIYLNKIIFYTCFYTLFYLFSLSIFTALFGFFIGEWSDIADDTLAGKINTVAIISTSKKCFISLLLLFFITINIYVLKPGFYISILILLQYSCFLFYSVKPFRLKRSRIFAPILDALYSGTLFYIICFETLSIPIHLYIYFIVWAFLKGLRNILSHLIKDSENDIRANIVTLGNSIETNRLIWYSRLIIFFEFVFFVIGIFRFKLWILGVVFLIFYFYWINRDIYKIPFICKRKTLIKRDKFLDINQFHEFFFPLVMYITICIQIDIKYLIILPLLVLSLKI